MNHWFYWDLYQWGAGVVPNQSLQPERCDILNSFWVFLNKKKQKQHFRYQFLPLEIEWLKIIEHQLRCETSMFAVQNIFSHFTKISGIQWSGSKLKPPQKVFFPPKKMVRIVWTVQSPRYLTFPSFYVSPFERSADRTWFQFLVWPGQWTPLNRQQRQKTWEYFAPWKESW